jgi:hypothetical protein
MKNKIICLALTLITVLSLASCAGSRNGYQRKGYGCPTTASIQTPFIEKNSI